jgi:hypothetical protein
LAWIEVRFGFCYVISGCLWGFDRIYHLFLPYAVRESLKELTKQFDKSENDLKALQSVGQIVGEVLKQLTEDKCKVG